MNNRYETKQFILTVEGETEQWYFEWLEGEINKCPKRSYNVSLKAKKCPNPKDYYKNVNKLTSPRVFHICDVESKGISHVEKFTSILHEMKNAKTYKKIKYDLGYSNYTFELWIILHKIDYFKCLTDRKQYIDPVNKIFGEKLINLDDYKHEDNFKRCINKLSIYDVIKAISRAEKIASINEIDGKKLICMYGYEYYEENPALSINVVIKNILQECGILEKNKKKKNKSGTVS